MRDRARLAAAVLALILVACAGRDATMNGPRTTPASAAPAIAPSAGDSETETERSSGPSAVPRFSKKRAMSHVRKLARSIGVRERATPNERKGARYVARTFRSFGYEVAGQRFKVDGGRSRNIIASWPGSKRYGFVIGGHMDSVPGAPGANDNASGTAVVLELARLFAGTPQADQLRFVGFGSEEYGDDGRHHVGSAVYVKRLRQKGRHRLAGMVSVDMIADGRPLLVGNSDIADNVVARTLYRKIKRGGTRVRYITLCDCSDHGPFERAGIPAAFAYSGRESDYHSPSDTVVNLKPRDLLRTGRAMRTFVKAVDGNMLRKFRRH